MKIELHNHPNYSAVTWITPEMEAFSNKINQAGLDSVIKTASVSLVPAGYYCVPPIEGEYGYIGPYCGEQKDKPQFDKTLELLCINIVVPKAFVEQTNVKPLLQNLKNEEGKCNWKQPTWSCMEINETEPPVTKKYGWYKKPGFDKLMEAMSAMCETTECELACYGVGDGDADEFNTNLVECLEYDETKPGCVHTFECTSNVTKPTGLLNVYFSIINTNIEENTPILLEVLSLASPHQHLRP